MWSKSRCLWREVLEQSNCEVDYGIIEMEWSSGQLVEVERTATAVGNLKRSEVSELVFGKRKQRNGQQIYFPSLFASILIDENGILHTFWYKNVDLN